MITDALAELGRQLPRVAEEGPDRASLPESVLMERISEAMGGQAEAKALVATIRRMFRSLSLLDEDALANGRWQLVSFPALLCARSLLAGLGDSTFKTLENGFWEASEYRVDRQRDLLRQLETQRRSTSSDPRPIRRVWVSWALMCSDKKLLLVRREESRDQRNGSRGSFVMPGGKLSATDLVGLSLEERLAYFDPTMLLPETDKTLLALTRTLTRELDEEIELGGDKIATLSASHTIIRYVDLEGSGSAHALTEYIIQVFRVTLTDAGKLRLLRSLAAYPERYTWFTAAELLDGKNAAGNTCFVDALVQEFGAELGSALDPAQSDLGLSLLPVGEEPLDMPFVAGEPMLIGQTGKERKLMLGLDAEALADLCFLAAVRRGDPVQDLATGVSIVPGRGWVLIEEDDLFARMKLLEATLLRVFPERSPIAVQGRAMRLNVCDPALVRFSPMHFSLAAKDEKRGTEYRIRLNRVAIQSRLGTVEALIQETIVAETLGSAIYGLLHGNSTIALDKKESIKRLQRGELFAFLAAAGLRLLVREVDGVPELTVKRAVGQP